MKQTRLPTPKPPVQNTSKTLLGIDIGTSGLRACVVKKTQDEMLILASTEVPLEAPICLLGSSSVTQNPNLWLTALHQLLLQLSQSFNLSLITHLILDATSSTVLLGDSEGNALTLARMYNDQHATIQAKDIQKSIPPKTHTAAVGSTCTLAKVILLCNEHDLETDSPVIMHQIDFLNHALCGALNITDENNALKLGYDSVHQIWPDWVEKLIQHAHPKLSLPNVVQPGEFIGYIQPEFMNQYGFCHGLEVCAGTTDSIAGFLASGAQEIGDITSSLGSTLAFKMISDRPFFSPKEGIYSHRLKGVWLVGGASNTGGAVLTNTYSLSEIIQLLKYLEKKGASNNPLLTHQNDDCYPLIQVGERFPISNPNLNPTLPDKPKDSLRPENQQAHIRYFLDLIQGLINIEILAIKRLSECTGTVPSRLFSVGGGIKNPLWMEGRFTQLHQQFKIKAVPSKQTNAAYGVTLLIK
ncbi:MAG: hypothetical protein GXO35_06865 [Gammaproteobacteria bacterium]|nr:hypothetical protein [Gammaproteobacteria bacterium]